MTDSPLTKAQKAYNIYLAMLKALEKIPANDYILVHGIPAVPKRGIRREAEVDVNVAAKYLNILIAADVIGVFKVAKSSNKHYYFVKNRVLGRLEVIGRCTTTLTGHDILGTFSDSQERPTFGNPPMESERRQQSFSLEEEEGAKQLSLDLQPEQ